MQFINDPGPEPRPQEVEVLAKQSVLPHIPVESSLEMRRRRNWPLLHLNPRNILTLLCQHNRIKCITTVTISSSNNSNNNT